MHFSDRSQRLHTGARATSARLLLIAAVLLLVALIAAPAAAATEGSSSAAPASGDKTILRVGLLEDADNLNPFVGMQITSYLLWHLNYDFLVGFEPGKLEPRPEIAESWTTSDDGTTWTFKIRQGMTWQDGQPVTARDVAFTFNYIVDNELVNLAVYTAGITGARAIDDATVEITTDGPKSNMLAMVVPILPEHIWSKVSGKAAQGSYQNPPPIVGSGPFQVVEWKKGQYIRLEANKKYWKGAPKVDDVIFQIYTNANSMVSDLKAGAIDGAVDIPMAQFAGLENTPGITAIKATSWKFTELGFNCYDSPNSQGNPVLLDQRFRQALQYAVDRDKIVATAFNGYASVGTSTLPAYSRFHWEPPADMVYKYDPEKAKAMLDAAGYKDTDGNGIREFKGKDIELRLLVTNDYPPNETTAKLVTGWFKQVGIDVALSVVDAGGMLDAQYTYKGNTFAPDYDMFIWYWTGDPDPYFNVVVPTTGQIEGWNDTCWTDPEYDRLAVAQAQELDPAKRLEIVHQMQEIIFAGSPYLVFTYPDQLEAYRTDKWYGWVNVPGAMPGYTGAALYPYTNIDTYLMVGPKEAAASDGGGSNSLIVALVVAGVVVAGVVVWALARRRDKAVEE